MEEVDSKTIARWQAHLQHCVMLLGLPRCPDRPAVEAKVARLRELLRGRRVDERVRYWWKED